MSALKKECADAFHEDILIISLSLPFNLIVILDIIFVNSWENTMILKTVASFRQFIITSSNWKSYHCLLFWSQHHLSMFIVFLQSCCLWCKIFTSCYYAWCSLASCKVCYIWSDWGDLDSVLILLNLFLTIIAFYLNKFAIFSDLWLVHGDIICHIRWN